MLKIALSKFASAALRIRRALFSQRFGMEVSDIYNNEFYRHDVDENQAASAGGFAEALLECFSPRTLIDIGCGNGIYLRELNKRNVQVVGCDGSSHGVLLCPPEVFVFQFNLKEVLAVNRRFDLCLCLEVAEHIPNRYSQNLVETCCRASDLVVFSAAPVGQGGTDHINEQPAEYWENLFAQAGFRKSHGDTAKLREKFNHRNVVHWLRENTSVYRKVSSTLK